ncbi:protein OXIDATIVE STRESS 3 LIKE 1 isoform X2 [Ziziphus jujuba]|uniref:Protein OXIDATIVE STRESS 3 LIKE 1 isoform X2 n=2 Tax=Ziziphus jujuba TaxID=326968 RepID=A0A6P3Z014_ZIZJJ|nr:protein OXIDATIVE STRESS 3 LIKE 1 isoform X2 [Ziziphus jujuba]
MSIALESNGGDAIRRSRLGHRMPFNSIYDSQEPNAPAEGDHRRLEHDSDSCSSSSIGRNSDLSGGSSDGEESANDEVQSSYKGPLGTMDALEEVLPLKRGISKFYGGKSKSFTSLADASSVSSIKDLAKPENPYNKKRKNLLARTNPLEKSRNCPLKNNGGGILKKLANSNRNSNLLGDTLSSSGCNNNHDDSNLFSTSPSSCLPPLHPHIKRSPGNGSSSPPQRQSPWRSFSLSDLQCVAASTPNITGLAIYSGDEDNKSH